MKTPNQFKKSKNLKNDNDDFKKSKVDLDCKNDNLKRKLDEK